MKRIAPTFASMTVALVVWGSPCVAATFSATGTGSDGTDLAASVEFKVVGGQLVVTL